MKTAGIRNDAAEPDAEEAQIERLWMLDKLKLGPVGYYSALASSENEILAVGAANALLSESAVPEEMRDRIVALSNAQSVQMRAFDFFLKEYDYDRLRAVIDMPGRSSDELIRQHFKATFANDWEKLVGIEIERFHRTGNLSSLHAAAVAAENSGGWRMALPLRIDLVLINPQDPHWQFRLIHTLRNVNRYDLIERFCTIIEKAKAFAHISPFLRALLALHKGEATQGLRWLERVPTKGIPVFGALAIATTKGELRRTPARLRRSRMRGLTIGPTIT